MVTHSEKIFEAGNLLYMSKKAPPMALQSSRALKVLFKDYEDVTFPPERLAMTAAGKGIKCRDANNFLMQWDGAIATIGRRNILFSISPKDLPLLRLNKGDLVGIVGDVPADNSALKNNFHFICVPDRENNKHWDVIGLVDLPHARVIDNREVYESHFLSCARKFMEQRKKKGLGKAHAYSEEEEESESIRSSDVHTCSHPATEKESSTTTAPEDPSARPSSDDGSVSHDNYPVTIRSLCS